MARSVPLSLLFPGLAALAFFNGCGGAADPDLFSSGAEGGALSGKGGGGVVAGSSSTVAGSGSSMSGGSAGGASSAGASSSGASGGSASGGSSSAGQGGSSVAGASNGGTSGSGHAGANTGGSSGSGHGGAGGAPHAGAGGGAGGAAAAGAGSGGSAGASAGSGGTAGGNAGSGGDPSCAQLFNQAEKQLEAARGCNIAMNVEQCTGKVNSTCGCPVPVQRSDSAATKAYQATLKQIDKKNCAPQCAALACYPLVNAQCKVPGGSTAGLCTAANPPN